VKEGIHPEWVETKVHCVCGNEWTTHSTKPELRVELCSNCHPYYTGNMRIVDTGGQVERFMKRMRQRQQPAAAASE
jgi:large subunit ribosomal protein L31